MKIHARGWKSVFSMPNPPGFLGCSSLGAPFSMIQRKRWATGLLKILFSKDCPIFATLTAKLQLRQCLAYIFILTWGLSCIPDSAILHYPPIASSPTHTSCPRYVSIIILENIWLKTCLEISYPNSMI